MKIRKELKNRSRSSELTAFEKAAVAQLRRGDKLGGKDGILAPLIKRIVEASLEGELEDHLEEDKARGNANRRIGSGHKQLKTEYGTIDLETGRDRVGSFDPLLVHKRQTVLCWFGFAIRTNCFLFLSESGFSGLKDLKDSQSCKSKNPANPDYDNFGIKLHNLDKFNIEFVQLVKTQKVFSNLMSTI